MSFQLTTSGLIIEDESEARADLISRAKFRFGAGVRTEPGSFVGDIISIFLQRYILIQQSALDLYSSFSRTAAEAAALDNLASIIGISRLQALPSTVPGEVTGTPTTVIPAGSRARIPSGSTWVIQSETTIGAGPTPTVLASEEDGNIEAATTGLITEIVDTVVGWDTVTNTGEASLGRLLETDTVLRVRMKNSLSSGTSSSESAIRSDLENEDNDLALTHVSVRSNRTSVTNADGVPPKTYHAVVLPPTANINDIALVLWNTQPAGIDSHGSNVANVIDDQGFEQPVKFDFGTEIEFYVDVTLTKKAAGYPPDGDDQVKAAVVAYGVTLLVGQDIFPKQIECAILDDVNGLDDVSITVGIASSPTNTALIVIASNEIGRFATARVTVLP